MEVIGAAAGSANTSADYIGQGNSGGRGSSYTWGGGALSSGNNGGTGISFDISGSDITYASGRYGNNRNAGDNGTVIVRYQTAGSSALSINAADINLQGNISDLSTLTLESSVNTNVISGVLSGSLDLVKNGTGKIAFTGSNTFSGGTQVNAGSLGLYNNAAAGTGSITFADNTDLLIGRSVTEIANDFILNGSTTIDLDTNIEYLIVGGGGGGGVLQFQ
jgi:autotransporter-associated beta strand protein